VVSYYAPKELVSHIGARDFFTDMDEGITFGRIDFVTNNGTLDTMIEKARAVMNDPHRGGFVSFMIHEQYFHGDYVVPLADFEARVLEPARMLYEAGYRGAHIREVLPKR
jgi:hypothetical protein